MPKRLQLGAVPLICRSTEVKVRVSPAEAGRELARASNHQQATALVALCVEIREWEHGGGSWPMQCRQIVDAMTSQERLRAANVLGVLMDHLNEQRTT